MKASIMVTGNKFELEGFEPMPKGFTIYLGAQGINLIPNIIKEPDLLRFIFPAHANETEAAMEMSEAVRIMREHYKIGDDSFRLDFIKLPGMGHYGCTRSRKNMQYFI